MLWHTLGLPPGPVFLTGSGGKTTLAHALALDAPGSAIFCTTTHIRPSAELPVYTGRAEPPLRDLLRVHRAVCAGTPAAGGKLTAPAIPLDRLAAICSCLIVEADGSRGLPLKAHLPHEPVVPPAMGPVILLVGASGFGRPIAEAAHRPERFAQLCGAAPADPATPERTAAVLLAEGGFDAVVVNQADGREEAVRRLSALLPVPVYAAELRLGRVELMPSR